MQLLQSQIRLRKRKQARRHQQYPYAGTGHGLPGAGIRHQEEHQRGGNRRSGRHLRQPGAKHGDPAAGAGKISGHDSVRCHQRPEPGTLRPADRGPEGQPCHRHGERRGSCDRKEDLLLGAPGKKSAALGRRRRNPAGKTTLRHSRSQEARRDRESKHHNIAGNQRGSHRRSRQEDGRTGRGHPELHSLLPQRRRQLRQDEHGGALQEDDRQDQKDCGKIHQANAPLHPLPRGRGGAFGRHPRRADHERLENVRDQEDETRRSGR